MNQRPIINYDDTCNLISFFFFLPLLSRISLRDHCGTFRCSEINCDSQFLNMALKAEWLTQLDLCDYGKSVRLYCLPGAILTTNPQLIEPNSAFCLTVRLFFPPPFSHRQMPITPPWSIIALLKYREVVRFNCAAKLTEKGLTTLNDYISLRFVVFPVLFVFSSAGSLTKSAPPDV